MLYSTTQFTVPAVAHAMAEVIGERELVIQGDKRFSYAQILEPDALVIAEAADRTAGRPGRTHQT
jgi:hypothetical protein